MILVDSSVWIEALRRPASRVFQRLELLAGDHACTCGVIIQEILQGASDPLVAEQLYRRMLLLPYLKEAPDTYRTAAQFFRQCRQHGIGVHTVDAFIMAIAVQHGVAVFTLDADFERAAAVLRNLKLYT